MKRIRMLAVGGTIAYVKGTAAEKDGKQLLTEASVDDEQAEVIVQDVLCVGSSELTVQDLFQIAREANRAVLEGVDGIVVTQGTDTLEETAFFLNLTVPHKIPVVITGAMKHGGLLGADGAANVNEAVIAASSPLLRQEGCVVVFDDKVLPSWYVRKTHTQALETFQSQFGPIGYFSEGKLRVIAHAVQPEMRENFTELLNFTQIPEVYIETVFLGNDGRMLKKAVEAGYRGIVLEGVGGGHCSSKMAEAISMLGSDFPIVMSSRTGSGEVLNGTYSRSPGSETALLKQGVIFSGILDSRKSRLLLILLLLCGMSISEIREAFRRYSVFDYQGKGEAL